VADAKRRTAGVGVGDTQVEEACGHAFDLDELDARLAAGDEAASHAYDVSPADPRDRHGGVARELRVGRKLVAEHAVRYQRLVHVAHGEAHDRADDRSLPASPRPAFLNHLDEIAVGIAHDDRLALPTDVGTVAGAPDLVTIAR
jgi:hypothetical protein